MFNFHIDVPAFLQTLPMMLKGMLGIFAVILVIYGCIFLFNRIFKEKKEEQ